MKELIESNEIHFSTNGDLPALKRYLSENEGQRPKSIMSDDQRPDYSLLKSYNTPFDNPKQLAFMERILYVIDSDSIVLDFFSGSGTTAHAVMNLNAQDKGNRRFIMIQLPELVNDKSEAHEKGFKNIAEIGMERIRCAGINLKEKESAKDLDVGFRVFKVDSSNMTDVFYSPGEVNKIKIDEWEVNVKGDRSPEDLLIQSMLELGIDLSAKITTESYDDIPISIVDDGYLVAALSENCSESLITSIAKRSIKPAYVIIRNGQGMTDEMLTNIEQIFKTYSPSTTIRLV